MAAPDADESGWVERDRPPPPSKVSGGPIQRLLANKESPWHVFNAQVLVEAKFKKIVEDGVKPGGGGMWGSAAQADTHLALTWDHLILASDEYNSPEMDIRRVEHLSSIKMSVDIDRKRLKVSTSTGVEGNYTIENKDLLDKFKVEVENAEKRYRFIPNLDALDKEMFALKIDLNDALYGRAGQEFLIDKDPTVEWNEESIESAANATFQFLKIQAPPPSKNAGDKKPENKPIPPKKGKSRVKLGPRKSNTKQRPSQKGVQPKRSKSGVQVAIRKSQVNDPRAQAIVEAVKSAVKKVRSNSAVKKAKSSVKK